MMGASCEMRLHDAAEDWSVISYTRKVRLTALGCAPSSTTTEIGFSCAHGRWEQVIDQQAEQFRATIVAAQIHQLFAPMDQRKIKV